MPRLRAAAETATLLTYASRGRRFFPPPGVRFGGVWSPRVSTTAAPTMPSSPKSAPSPAERHGNAWPSGTERHVQSGTGGQGPSAAAVRKSAYDDVEVFGCCCSQVTDDDFDVYRQRCVRSCRGRSDCVCSSVPTVTGPNTAKHPEHLATCTRIEVVYLGGWRVVRLHQPTCRDWPGDGGAPKCPVLPQKCRLPPVLSAATAGAASASDAAAANCTGCSASVATTARAGAAAACGHAVAVGAPAAAWRVWLLTGHKAAEAPVL